MPLPPASTPAKLKLPTPSTTHLDPLLNTTIYSPAEDSYLLLDTLSSPSETTFLQAHFATPAPAPLALEVGTGSGVVIAFLTAHAHAIVGRDVLSLGSDVNWEACLGTRGTVEGACADVRRGGVVSESAGAVEAVEWEGARPRQSITATTATTTTTETRPRPGTYLSSLNADLATPLRPNSVDILVFNPPYVPSESLPSLPLPLPPQSPSTTPTPTPTPAQKSQARFDRESHLLALSYAGGRDGMETTNRLLESLPATLSRRGVAYVLFCARNRPAEVAERVRGWDAGAGAEGDGEGEWAAEVVGESGGMGGWERLCVLRIWRRGRGEGD